MRKRIRTTTRGVPREILEMAAVEVLDKGNSVRSAAKTFKICHVTLRRYIQKVKQLQETGITDTSSIQVGYQSHNRVFTPVQEAELMAYLKDVAGVHSGLSSKEVRKLAFQIAKHNQLKYPEAWNTSEMAGKDWFSSFMKRNPQFPIKSFQRPGVGRAMGFNKENVSNFFQSLGKILESERLEAQDVWNVDETGVGTGHAPEDAAATEKDGDPTESAPVGEVITMAVAVNALGNSVPPHLVFPVKQFHQHFIRDGPTGSVGSANGSGQMEDAEFLVFLRHFVKHTRASVNGKVLLLLDRHSWHMSTAAMDYCEANGIITLNFPPHCSHKLQPLIRGVFGPFRRNFRIAMDCWMKTHPGTPATIFDLPGLISQALLISATPKNITAGFRRTGIWPFNSNIFDDEDFNSSLFSDWPNSSSLNITANPSDDHDSANSTHDLDAIAKAAGLSVKVITPDHSSSPRDFDFGTSALDPTASGSQSLPSTSKSSADDSLTVVKKEPRTPVPVPRRRRKRASPIPFSAPLHSTPAEDVEGEKEEAGPAVKCKAHSKRKGRKTEATADGTCPCLFCDDYYLTTV